MPGPKKTPNTGVKGEKKKAARDLVQLKHVETHTQQPITLSDALKEQIKHIKETEASAQPTLNEDEFAALSAIAENKRLFLVRIQLIVNQARVPLGKEMLHDEEIQALMTALVEKGFVAAQTVETEGIAPREIYTLTEQGKDFLA